MSWEAMSKTSFGKYFLKLMKNIGESYGKRIMIIHPNKLLKKLSLTPLQNYLVTVGLNSLILKKTV